MTVSNKAIETINIEGHDIEKLIYKGHPVITFKMMDELHERPSGTAGRNFRHNRDKFIEEKDYFTVPFEEWKEVFARRISSNGQDTGQRNLMTFLTFMGYMMLVKSFTDDKAWSVQRALSENYFEIKQAKIDIGSVKKKNDVQKTNLDTRKLEIAHTKADIEMKKWPRRWPHVSTKETADWKNLQIALNSRG